MTPFEDVTGLQLPATEVVGGGRRGHQGRLRQDERFAATWTNKIQNIYDLMTGTLAARQAAYYTRRQVTDTGVILHVLCNDAGQFHLAEDIHHHKNKTNLIIIIDNSSVQRGFSRGHHHNFLVNNINSQVATELWGRGWRRLASRHAGGCTALKRRASAPLHGPSTGSAGFFERETECESGIEAPRD